MSLSKLQSPMTTKWLYDNYEMSNGVSLPRSSLYNHYLDFCQKNCLQPVNAASFGKIIRHTFPTLKTRRLGTRGQSKYHYYGICVKESSPYHDAVYNSVRQSASGFSQTYSRSELEKSSQATSLKQPACSQVITSSNGILLPDFPSADTVDVHDVKLQDKVKTFLIMYRAHCQRILDTILRANFSEVQHFLLHFWRGMPPHISVILDLKEVIELIAVCDQILYKAMSSVLIPGTLQPLPASLTQAIKQFAKQLCHWLELSLHHVPEPLQDRKLLVARAFTQLLCRQTSLSHLAQAARSVLHSSEPVNQMAEDLKTINPTSIIESTLWMATSSTEKDFKLIHSLFQEFAQLLEQQSTVDQYIDWISSLVARCVIKPSEKEKKSFQKVAQKFLLLWSFFCSKFVQELTLKSAKSFGSFHLLQMLFDDYIFYLIESHAIVSEELEDTFHDSIKRNRHTDIGELSGFQSILNEIPNQNSQNCQVRRKNRTTSNSSSSNHNGYIICHNQEEVEIANIQTVMGHSAADSTNRSMTFPYDNQHAQLHYTGNSICSVVHTQKATETAGQTYFNDHGTSSFHPYKQSLEYNGQGTSGHFLTQELERLHMTYGTENLFDRNYFFQRELSA